MNIRILSILLVAFLTSCGPNTPQERVLTLPGSIGNAHQMLLVADKDFQKSGLVDTMWDLIIDTAGALIVSLSAYIYYRTGHKSRVINEIQEFLSLNKSYFHNNK